MSLRQKIRKYLSNLSGWRTKQKFIVIESDDWGSIRMSNSESRKVLIQKGIVDEKNRYNQYDTLASTDDLASLFEVLCNHQDKNKNSAVFTPVTITGNPDFEKIRDSDFEHYYCQPFTETLEQYYGNGRGIFQMWKEGIDTGIFKPQFHGREHLNVPEWMRALKRDDQATKTAFDHGVWGFDTKKIQERRISSYQAAFDFYDSDDLDFHKTSIIEGLKFFESIFGYKANFFVPPNGPFNNSLEETAAGMGIKYMSKSKIQMEPLGNGNTRKVYNKLGQKNSHDQIYLTRNCIFDPSIDGVDWVNFCLNDIKIAFRMRKPAVISTHRVNYIGALEESNRKRGLQQLDQLLEKIIKMWPDVEFITSDQLGDIIKKDTITNEQL